MDFAFVAADNGVIESVAMAIDTQQAGFEMNIQVRMPA